MLYVAIIQGQDQQEQHSQELAAWAPSPTTEVNCNLGYLLSNDKLIFFLQTNIQTYTCYIILSLKIKAYKSNVAEHCVWVRHLLLTISPFCVQM